MWRGHTRDSTEIFHGLNSVHEERYRPFDGQGISIRIFLRPLRQRIHERVQTLGDWLCQQRFTRRGRSVRRRSRPRPSHHPPSLAETIRVLSRQGVSRRLSAKSVRPHAAGARARSLPFQEAQRSTHHHSAGAWGSSACLRRSPPPRKGTGRREAGRSAREIPP